MIAAHLPLVLVILPLLAAPVLCLLPRGHSWLLLVVMVACLIFTLQLTAITHLGNQSFPYYVGDWAPPVGIELRVDALSSFFLLIVDLIAVITLLYMPASLSRDISAKHRPLFYSLFALLLAGMHGMVVTHDAFNLYVFLEIFSLAGYALVATGKDRRALTAAFQYLMLGTIGATFLLFGIGILYRMTGTLNLEDMSQGLFHVKQLSTGTAPLFAAFACIMLGLLIKIAIFPLHLWLPNAYAHAPHSVSAFLAATSVKVSLYAMLRFLYSLFGGEEALSGFLFGPLLIGLGIAAILTGALVACRQQNLKCLLAYSSISQIGYILLGIGLVSLPGLATALLMIANHALAKGALFMAVGCIGWSIAHTAGTSLRLEHLGGLAQRLPWSCMAFTLAALALAGMPFTNGFISKWQLFQAVWPQEGGIMLAIIIAGGSLLAVVYVWRVLEIFYLAPLHPVLSTVREAPALMLIPTWVMVILCYVTGVDTSLTLGMAQTAAEFLTDGHKVLMAGVWP